MTQLTAVASRLFEVVADDLVELDQLVPVPIEPARKLRVELCASLLRQRVVGGVTDEQMPKAERMVAGERCGRRMDQLLANEPVQLRFDVRCLRQLEHGTAMEDLPLDSAPLDH